jgi:phosphotransferase system HPr (HPr) family protein
MVKVDVVLNNEQGLHARPASEFTRLATTFNSEIKVIKDDIEYNGKSILHLMSMVAAKGDKLTIVAEGDDEEKAINELKKLVEVDFLSM